jgi:predicted dinucleotide-binding enzyme
VDIDHKPQFVPTLEGSMSTSITIIGAGNMGRGIAYIAASGGNPVTISDRDPQDATDLVREVRAEHPRAVVEVGSLDRPITSDVIVLAVWYTAAQDLARQLADQLAGKVVVDISNPRRRRARTSPAPGSSWRNGTAPTTMKAGRESRTRERSPEFPVAASGLLRLLSPTQ